MKFQNILLSAGLIDLLNNAAVAAGDENIDRSSHLTDAIVGFAPIVLFLVILYFFFRRQINSPAAKRQQEYVARQIEHTQRVEDLLTRIAAALEKRNGDRP